MKLNRGEKIIYGIRYTEGFGIGVLRRMLHDSPQSFKRKDEKLMLNLKKSRFFNRLFSQSFFNRLSYE